MFYQGPHTEANESVLQGGQAMSRANNRAWLHAPFDTVVQSWNMQK